jgi:hypothetical protein
MVPYGVLIWRPSNVPSLAPVAGGPALFPAAVEPVEPEGVPAPGIELPAVPPGVEESSLPVCHPTRMMAAEAREASTALRALTS